MKNRPENNKPRRKMWTLKEERFVEQHYGKVSTKEIAQKVGRTVVAIHIKARKLACSKESAALWSEEEIAIIQAHFLANTREPLAKVKALLPNRSYRAITHKISRMGMAPSQEWSDEEHKVLEQYYPTLGSAVAEKLPGRTQKAVHVKARKSGIRYVGGEQSKRWSKEEKCLLKANLHLSKEALQSLFFPERTISSVDNAKKYLKKRQKS